VNELHDLIWNKSISKKTAIVTHIEPDGDGLPASLALKWILQSQKIEADIVLPEICPEIFDYLDGRNNTIIFDETLSYQTVILVDCHEKGRIGKCANLLDKCENIITIDHHPQNYVIDGAKNYINTSYVSAGAIIFEMFENEINKLDFEIRNKIVSAIYTTILNDSGNFINANTDAKSFKIAAKLVELGLVAGDIAEKFLVNNSIDQMKFVGESLSTISTFDNKQIVFFHSTNKMLEDNKLSTDDTSKMTTWLKGIKGVKVVVYFREISENKYKLSLRSNFINVKKIANKYDGGGHIKAAG